MLSDFLRYELSLTGTKVVCAEGGCGACTVLCLFIKKKSQTYLPVNSCIIPVALMDGSSIITIEGIQTAQHELHEVQKNILKHHGSQCGFCTPGVVVTLAGMVEKTLNKPEGLVSKKPERQKIKNALTGNLCRCTGYEPIIKSGSNIDLSKCTPLQSRYLSRSEEKDLLNTVKQPLLIESEGFSYFSPTSMSEAVKYLAENKDACIVSSCTALGVSHNKYKIRLRNLMSLQLIDEYHRISMQKSRIHVGARVTLSELRTAVAAKIPELSRFINLFASPQIKNMATLAGNVGNASPVGDLLPFLLVSDAKIFLISKHGKRTVPVEEFFIDYKKTVLRRGEIISAISFDIPGKNEVLRMFKASQRKDLDISAVSAVFRIVWSEQGPKKIASARIAYGGVGPTPMRLFKTERLLEGAHLSPELFSKTAVRLQSEIHPTSDLRGSEAYRRIVAQNFLRRLFLEVCET